MSTNDNLQSAFAGESQANRKYLAFAQKAQADGFFHIARLFRAAADAETVHALAHLRVMGGIKSTAENLRAAIKGEGFEFEQMYPQFIKEAEEENHNEAIRSFRYALVVEQIHYKLYGEALKLLESGKDLADKPIFVCQTCGNTVLNSTPGSCPICSSPKSQFKEIK